jgi:2,3-bisphosphoglycerate-dependent phosphoglycerate mutase
MTTFHLVRHAHADWTPDKQRPLSARGRQDAGRVADILQPYPTDAIYTSPYRRARETIAPLAARLDLPVRVAPGLRERRLGRISQDFFGAVETTWRDPASTFPGGESNAAAQKRGLALVQRLRRQHPAEHVVLSTHGNLLALILQGFDSAISFEFWQSLSVPDVYTLHLDPAGVPVIDRLWPEDTINVWRPI